MNPVKKAASDTAKVSKNPILSDNSIKSPYVLDALALVQWLNDSEGRVQSVDLPVEISGYLSQLEGQLLGFGGSTTSITEGGAMEEEKQGDAVTTNIKGMLALTSTAQKLLRVGAALGGDAFLKVLCSLLRAAVVSASLYCTAVLCCTVLCYNYYSVLSCPAL